jgi:dihydroorotate dehydrogenase electron transfer subunit
MSAATGTSRQPPGGGSPTLTIATVLANEAVADELFRMKLSVPPLWGPPAAGQFVSVTLEPPWDDATAGEAGGALLRRPFGIAGYARDGQRAVLEILIAPVGTVTRRLARLPQGATLDLLGPAGTAFPEPAAGEVLLVGGGHGIAPLLPLARRLRDHERSYVLFYGARRGAQLARLPEFGGALQVASEDGGRGLRGTVLDLLERYPRRDRATLLACGPRGMLAAVARWSRGRGYPCWVSLEEIFGCSLGLCGGCAVPARGGAGAYERYLWACRDGPVVPAERVDWEAWELPGGER